MSCTGPIAMSHSSPRPHHALGGLVAPHPLGTRHVQLPLVGGAGHGVGEGVTATIVDHPVTVVPWSVEMAEVVLFHHVQGLTDGVPAFAAELRAGGHTLHTPRPFAAPPPAGTEGRI